jgi:O-antigen ligase
MQPDVRIPSFNAWVGAPWLLTLAWLNPFTHGPTPPMVQFLLTWAMAALWCLVSMALAQGGADRLRAVATAWLLAAALSAAMGLVQYLGYAQYFSPWISFVEAGQAYANLRQRNQQATLLAIGLCALLWWQAQASVQSWPAWRRLGLPWCLAGVAALLATADAAAGSRTGMLQLVLLLGLCLLWRRGSATLLLVLFAYGLAALVLPRLAGLDALHSGILGRLAEPASPCASRLTLWSNVLELIAQKPWTGWGWGELGYAHFMHLYQGARFCEIMGNAHNLPLHLAVELGLPLALALCGALVWVVLRARPWRETSATRQLAWSVLAVIGIHSLLEYPLWYAPFQLAALLAVVLLWQSGPKPQSPVAASGAGLPMRRHATAAVACAVLLACSYAAWDYWRISQIYLGESARAAAYRDDTLEKIRPSWLFAKQVKFAELGVTSLTADNAAYLHTLALEMLHFSPEASVAARIVESAEMLGLKQEAQDYRTRFQAAYPQDYAAWAKGQPLAACRA